MQDLTPALRQYIRIKEKYPDCILFFRMGDFYEMFFEDALTAHPILEIALTTRDKNKSDPVPMCGIPYHAADTYIIKLLNRGMKVAVCEQMEDPAEAKGLIRREVVRVITPGLVAEVSQLADKEHTYIAGIVRRGGVWGAAFLDFSTGEVKVTELAGVDELIDELSTVRPREAVLPEDLREDDGNGPISRALADVLVNYIDAGSFEPGIAEKIVTEIYGIAKIDGLGLGERTCVLAALGGLFRYVIDYQKTDLSHLSFPRLYVPSEFMVMDEVTRRNLELNKTVYEGAKRGSLLSLIDRTSTPMGGRLIREWINYPLMDTARITERLDGVQEFFNDRELCEKIDEVLAGVTDLERLVGRVSLKVAGGRDLMSLSDSLAVVPTIRELLSGCGSGAALMVREGLDDFSDLVSKIRETLVESPPHSIREGGVIRDGVDTDLDELRMLSRSGKDWIVRLEADERRRTGIPLKVRFNRVFGYYIEVTNSYLSQVPDDYIRKQTLVGAERFITPDLKEYEAKVLGAEDRIKAIEYDLFCALREGVREWIVSIKRAAVHLATLDVLTTLALVAREYGYQRPMVDDGTVISIVAGRHPMVERALPPGTFVPNDIIVGGNDRQILIITGPNMAGKSTIIRQAAVICLMAQMGSFVPADSAQIGVADRIFARVGASDSIVRGQSTFMVEMVETANILNNATSRSLVILDEIGRGTSTFDGISIAWAVAEYIHDNPRCRFRTLFATHYHELTELSAVKERVKNYHVAVREWNERIIFLRKLMEGVSSHSYGIEVARLAGIPVDVIVRAREILINLEKGEFTPQGTPTIATGKEIRAKRHGENLDLFSGLSEEIITEIASMDIYQMTPVEAMRRLEELKEKIKKIDGK